MRTAFPDKAPLAPSTDPPPAAPTDPDSLHALGLELACRGDPGAAAEVFRRAVRLSPRFAQAWQNLGVALGQAGDADGAGDALRQALEVDPDYFDARLNLAGVLAAEGRTTSAIDAYRTALACRPDSPDALNGLGLAFATVGRGAEGSVFLRQATRLRPGFAGAWNNLGLAEADAGRYAEAEAALDRALRLDPAYGEAHVNLGNALKEQGRLAEALACYDVGLWLRPGHAGARWNRSLALLQKGDYERGWQAYECRWGRGDPGARPPMLACPAWDGSPPAGRSILLWCEQGLGDAVQFVRYAELLKRAGAGRLTCWCPPPLGGVLSTCPWLDEVALEGREPPSTDLHVAVMSLPFLFGTTLDTVPAEVPYLRPDADRVRRWREVLAALPATEGSGIVRGTAAGVHEPRRPFTVGVVWQGNPHHRWDRHRSVPLTAFAPLAAVPGVRLVSLQRGPGVEQLGADGHAVTSAGRPTFGVADVLDRLADESDAVADVLALATAVDLVVTVDTLPAHLAGAAGVPVWVALSTMVDWRWLLGRADTPWYPSMRLFRQTRRGDWDFVFERMAGELCARVGEGVSREG